MKAALQIWQTVSIGLDTVIGDTISLDLQISVMDGSLPEIDYSADFKTYDKQNFQSIIYDPAAELKMKEKNISNITGFYLMLSEFLMTKGLTAALGQDFPL